MAGFWALPSLPARAWWCALASGCCCGLYYFGLTRAYASGDFTVVYPVARALPVLLVGLGDVGREGGSRLRSRGWHELRHGRLRGLPAPVAPAVSPQSLSQPQHRLAHPHRARTVGYTLVDKFAAEVARSGPAYAALYGYLFFCVSVLSFSLCLALFGKAEARGESVG